MVLQVASPAKLNLFLAVGPKDAVGYHPIRTIFQAIGLQDEVTIDLAAERTSIKFEGADIPENNTVSKALRLMSELCDLPKMGIRIQKNIPSEAGLGGGSSNAAAIIRTVRHLVPGLSASPTHSQSPEPSEPTSPFSLSAAEPREKATEMS